VGAFGLIPLHDRYGVVVAHAIVDRVDLQLASDGVWRLAANGYAVRREDSRTVYLHREILGLQPGDGMEGDHISRDKLDYRRSNLRIVTHAQNAQNVSVSPGKTSRHRGVCWDGSRGRWLAQAKVNGRNYYLGRFSSEEAAAEVARAFRGRHMPYSEDAS
jgi:hypothetical protein